MGQLREHGLSMDTNPFPLLFFSIPFSPLTQIRDFTINIKNKRLLHDAHAHSCFLSFHLTPYLYLYLGVNRTEWGNVAASKIVER